MKYTDYYNYLYEAIDMNGKDNGIPEDIEIQYAKLGTAQRGKAETLGTNPHRLLQGSLTYPLEHIGDLVHRLSYNSSFSKNRGTMQGGGGMEYGRDAALTKIDRALFYAQDFVNFGGMLKVVEDIAKRNYDYVIKNDNYENYEDWNTEWNKVLAYLKDYANEHKKLTPLCYSYYQKLGNQATIALGELDEKTYINALKKLQSLLKNTTWKKNWYNPNTIK